MVYTYVPNLSADGLRLFFRGVQVSGATASLFASRASLAAPFGPAEPLVGVPLGESDLYLTETCARVYLTGLGRVFYVQQQ